MTNPDFPSRNPRDDHHHPSLSGSERDLAAAMARAGAVSPQTARALQATENAWRTVDEAFGLLSSGEVARLLGRQITNRALVSRLRTQGRLLGVRRLNAYKYPGFQFDGHGNIEPVVADLLRLAKRIGWKQEDLVLWLCAPSGYFAGDRPVDRLHEPDELLARAENALLTEW